MLTALAGSLLGFLRYNFHPATIYMGDTGAMFLGLMLGAMSMIGQYNGGHQWSLLSPVFILGIPLYDTLFVIYIRILRGLPVFLGSPDHMALRLRHWGMTVPQVVILSYLATAATGVIGLAVMAVSETTALLLVGVTVAGMGTATLVLKRVDMTVPAKVPLPETAVQDVRGGVRS
jgi:UDP-GlcNAc:undecaprenyl-phosphate GlcNAc-1-phosphate transferase